MLGGKEGLAPRRRGDYGVARAAKHRAGGALAVEIVSAQKIQPHPEEPAQRASRRMGHMVRDASFGRSSPWGTSQWAVWKL